MIRFRLLGEIGLQAADGTEVHALLRQPKRLALLAYLVGPVPGTWHRRDTLLALFWPDLDSGRARSSLRNALYILRQTLGEAVVRTRGDDEVSIDPAALETDLGALRTALADGRVDEALVLYRGDLLPGLFPPESEGFQRWLDDERGQLKVEVARAAAKRAASLQQEGKLDQALAAARRVVEIDPDDEPAVRRLIGLHDAAGDRAGALTLFERYRARLVAEFDAEPASETMVMVERIRSATTTPAVRARFPTPSPGEELEAPSFSAAATPSARRPRRAFLVGSVLVGLAAVAVMVFRPWTATTPPATSILLLPMENATRADSNDYVATGLTDQIAKDLGRIPALTIKLAPSTRSVSALFKDDPRKLGRLYGSGTLVKTDLTLTGDGLAVRIDLVGLATGDRKQLGPQAISMVALRDAGNRVATTLAGAVLRAQEPWVSRLPPFRVDPESYRLTISGWHQQLVVRDPRAAKVLFLRAIDLDPTNARAWSGLAAVWGNLSTADPSGYAQLEAAAGRALAIDSTDGSAIANLAVVRAVRDRDPVGANALLERAQVLDPRNPEVYLLTGTLKRWAGQWEESRASLRIAARLDPLNPAFLEREAGTWLCQNNPREALPLFEKIVQLDLRNGQGHLGLVRTLARLGRWDDAIARWRSLATGPSDSAIARALATASGESGYWEVRHMVGRSLLARRGPRTGWKDSGRLGFDYIAAGLIDSGIAVLERASGSGEATFYNLPCSGDIDEARGLPRFESLVAKYGTLTPRSRP